MKTLVIDASVAAKWFLPSAHEPLSSEALDLLNQYGAGTLRFLVPDLFWAEIGNIFWKAARLQRWTNKDAEDALRVIRHRHIPTVSTAVLIEDALSLGIVFDRTVYDSLYVALALTSKTHLVTADERLANALAAHLPVKWLGALA